MSPVVIKPYLLIVCVLATLHCCPLLAAEHRYQLPEVVHPADNQPSEARLRLGKILFFDPRLSGANQISCASCHIPALMWSDGVAAAMGLDGRPLSRSTPSVLDCGDRLSLMWDGASDSLEAQAMLPIVDPLEMNQPLDELLQELAAIAGYRQLFAEAYGAGEIRAEMVFKALAVYQRSLRSAETPFDRWMAGDSNAISESAQRGFALFEGRAGCVACHSGPGLTDDGFHNIGVVRAGEGDLGRYRHRPVALAKWAFKTPSLRNVALSAPYMHNGRLATLEAVIEHYATVTPRAQRLSPNLREITLSERDKRDLLAFLHALSSIEPRHETPPELPR